MKILLPAWEGAVGTTGPDGMTELRARDRVKIGQIAGTFLLGALFKLEEEDDVELWKVPGEWIETPPEYGMSMHQLLGHNSGLPDFRNASGFDSTRDWTLAELADLVRDQGVLWGPGADWLESFTDYVIAAQVLEHLSGQDWRSSIEEEILAPYELVHTEFPGVGEGWSYALPSWQGDSPVNQDTQPTAWGPKAGAMSTAGDLATWMEAFLRSDLLDPGTINEIRETYFATDEVYYGIGIQQEFSGGIVELGHLSSLPGQVGWAPTVPTLTPQSLSWKPRWQLARRPMWPCVCGRWSRISRSRLWRRRRPKGRRRPG